MMRPLTLSGRACLTASQVMDNMVVYVVLVVLGSFITARCDVLQLVSSNFDQHVNGDRHAFVEFYAPWCGHCKRLAPAYEEVAAAFDQEDSVVVAKVDADSDRDLGTRFGVKGFPTLKFFPKGSIEPEDYNGGRTADDIISFINSKAGTGRNTKKAPSAVVSLDPSNFDSVVMDTDKDVLVEFFTPWCGHCKALAPTYEEVAATFKAEENCVVANVDADAQKDLAQSYGVTGYPTIKFFPRDNKKGEDYAGGRDASNFVEFLNGKCGTSRALGGKLSEDAGVVESMNVMAQEFMSSSEEREKIISNAQDAADAEEDASSASFYVKVMKKILDKGSEYVKKEYERLGRILGGDLSDKKSDELTKKRNVLRQFREL